MSAAVRNASPQDVTRLAALDATVNPHPWPRGRFDTVCSRPGAEVLLVGDGDRIDGFVVCSQVLDEGTVENLGVAPQMRRRGLARVLLGTALDRMRAARASRCLLEVRASNLPARALYESLGFRVDGIRPRYYASAIDGAREDAVLMSKSLWD